MTTKRVQYTRLVFIRSTSGLVERVRIASRKGVPFSGCPVPIFSYFLSLFLFSPIFKLKPPIFPIFLAGEAKICNKIENGIIVVCVFECN